MPLVYTHKQGYPYSHLKKKTCMCVDIKTNTQAYEHTINRHTNIYAHNRHTNTYTRIQIPASTDDSISIYTQKHIYTFTPKHTQRQCNSKCIRSIRLYTETLMYTSGILSTHTHTNSHTCKCTHLFSLMLTHTHAH